MTEAIPDGWRLLVCRWDEDELKGEAFMKHPSRNFLSDMINTIETFDKSVDMYIRDMGVRGISGYEPSPITGSAMSQTRGHCALRPIRQSYPSVRP